MEYIELRKPVKVKDFVGALMKIGEDRNVKFDVFNPFEVSEAAGVLIEEGFDGDAVVTLLSEGDMEE